MQRQKRLLAAIAGITFLFASFSQINFAQADIPSYDLVVHVPKALPKSAKVSVALSNNSAQSIGSSRAIGTDSFGWFGVVQVPANAGAILVSATGLTPSQTAIDPIGHPELWLSGAGTPYTSKLQATGKVSVHLMATGADRKNRSVQIKANNQTYSANFDKNLNATLTVPTNLTDVTLGLFSKSGGTLNQTSFDMDIDISANSDLYVSDSVDYVAISKAQLLNQAVIHYRRADSKYAGWTINTLKDATYGGALKPNTWSASQNSDSTKPDSWGITFTVSLAEGSRLLPYILHKANTVDPNANIQAIDLASSGGEVWIESGKADENGSTIVTAPVAKLSSIEGPSQDEATALVGTTPRSAFANDSIYFAMTDRYKNGDSNNDTGGLVGGPGSTGNDTTNPAFSHGGDLAGLMDGCSANDGSGDGLPRIKRLGFSAIWISPPFVQDFVHGGSASYHGYSITDFTRIDPHWGTNEQFKSFTDCAHRLGIKVIMDIVVNHTADIISFTNARGFSDVPNPTAYIPDGDENLKVPSFLNNLSNYHNMGNISNWGSKFEYQNGDFGGLDDIKTENQAVIDGFATVYSTWVNEYGVDAFRIDTAKHVDDQFFNKWWPKMISQTSSTMAQNNSALFAFGEYYDGSSSSLANYLHTQALPSALDFAFQNSADSFVRGGLATDLSSLLASDNAFLTPTKSAYNLVTFLGNHDMGRVASLIGNGLSAEQLRKADLLAHDVMFLTRGIPCVYYGDEVGMIGSGGDKAARQDMFSTRVQQWQEETRVWGDPIGIRNSFNIVTPLTTRLAQLNQLRKDNPALASGPQILRSQSGNVLVTSRIDQTQRLEYLVAFNSSKKDQTISIISSTPSSSFTPLLGSGKFSSDTTGKITLKVPAMGTLVLKAVKNLAQVAKVPNVYQTVYLDNAAKTISLTAGVLVNDPGSVTWAASINGGDWTRIATDDEAGYGMTWDFNLGRQAPLSAGTTVDIVAIYKSSSGTVSTSAAQRVVIK